MKIVSAAIYSLKIPFIESFKHALSERAYSDSIVVSLTTDTGVSGFGEAVPRPYVTGETHDGCVHCIKEKLLPGTIGLSFDHIRTGEALVALNKRIPETPRDGEIIWNAARCAVELALIDCYLKCKQLSLGVVLPPVSPTVTYSGVISSGSTTTVQKLAERCTAAGLKYVKMKVSGNGDVESVAMVRDILGPTVSIRLDANAAFTPDTAMQFIQSVAPYHIACVEQPIPRGDVSALATLQAWSPVPIMADESLVTEADALELIEKRAVRYFNLRISKCGGIGRTLAIARLAREAGIRVVLGCQVGETNILSAAGCHVAAHLADVYAVEGAYGSHLLVEDIADPPVMFGDGGSAPALTGAGLGCNVREDLLRRYAAEWIEM